MESQKSYICTVYLSGIFGIFGIHHFYLGCWIHGLLDLGMTLSALTLLFTGQPKIGLTILAIDLIHTLIVTVMLLTGTYKDGSGKTVTYPGQRLNYNTE